MAKKDNKFALHEAFQEVWDAKGHGFSLRVLRAELKLFFLKLYWRFRPPSKVSKIDRSEGWSEPMFDSCGQNPETAAALDTLATQPRLTLFHVHIPNEAGTEIEHTIQIQIPCRLDPETGIEILTPAGLLMIEDARRNYELSKRKS